MIPPLRQLEERLALDDCVIVRERVKRLNQHAAVARFHIDIAQRAESHSPARVKDMQEPPALTVMRQLLLKRPKDFGRHRLELKTRLIGYATATFHAIMTLSAQTVRQETPLLGQWILRGSGNFGQR